MKFTRSKLPATIVIGALSLVIAFCAIRGLYCSRLLNLDPHASSSARTDNHDRSALDDINTGHRTTNGLVRMSHSYYLAATAPLKDGFRNELFFQEPAERLANRHMASEIAYNRGGYQSMFTLEIVDDHGLPVSGVAVDIGPSLNWSKLPLRQCVTDSSGIIVIADDDANEYHIHASKKGYYDSDGTIQFFRHHYSCVEDGKWVPWNPHVELVLKPIGEYVSLDWLNSWDRLGDIPVEQDVPFDFLAFDFLPPFGTGRQTNAIVRIEGTYDPDEGMHSVAMLSFPFGGGFRKETADGFCNFLFPREIADGDFSADLVVKRDSNRQSGVRLVGGLIPCKEFFAMKIPIVDPIGITNYCYGVALAGPIASISGDEPGTGTLYLECYLNPEPGNRVVESTELLMRQSW